MGGTQPQAQAPLQSPEADAPGASGETKSLDTFILDSGPQTLRGSAVWFQPSCVQSFAPAAPGCYPLPPPPPPPRGASIPVL